MNGKVEVQPDCTAVAQLNVTSAGLTDSGKAWMVILDNGEELRIIQTESQMAKPIIAAAWKRNSHESVGGREKQVP